MSNDSIKKQTIDEQIKYFATDSIIYDLKNNLIKLYNKSEVVYNSIKLNAYFISINLKNNTLYAEGNKISNDSIIQNQYSLKIIKNINQKPLNIILRQKKV